MIGLGGEDMLVVYGLVNMVVCGIVGVCGGWIGVYGMVGMWLLMWMMYGRELWLGLKDLGSERKSGCGFVVM